MSKSLNNVHKKNIKARPETYLIEQTEDDEVSDELLDYDSTFDEDFNEEVPDGKNLLFAQGFLEKINFYSRYEDILKSVRKVKFFPEYTLYHYDILKTKNHAISSRKLKDYETALENLLRYLDDEVYISYRNEVRIVPIFYLDALSIISSDNACDYQVEGTPKVNMVIKDVTIAFLEALRMEYTSYSFINLL